MSNELLSSLLNAPLSRRRALERMAHLLGGAASASSIGAVLAACERPGAAGDAASLPGDRIRVVAAVVDHIIPPTDTPGAQAAGVHRFVDAVWRECFTAAERERFVAGLAELDERARAAHGRPFLECAAGQQAALLGELDAATFAPPAPAPPPRGGDAREITEPGAGETPLPDEMEGDTLQWRWGEDRRTPPEAPFWRTLKRLTLVGYYTSKAGATQELRYLPVPGRYEGCAPVGRTWAT